MFRACSRPVGRCLGRLSSLRFKAIFRCLGVAWMKYRRVWACAPHLGSVSVASSCLRGLPRGWDAVQPSSLANQLPVIPITLIGHTPDQPYSQKSKARDREEPSSITHVYIQATASWMLWRSRSPNLKSIFAKPCKILVDLKSAMITENTSHVELLEHLCKREGVPGWPHRADTV